MKSTLLNWRLQSGSCLQSDKNEHAKKGVLIGYDDQKETLLVKVYYPKKNTYAWVDTVDIMKTLDTVREQIGLKYPFEN